MASTSSTASARVEALPRMSRTQRSWIIGAAVVALIFWFVVASPYLTLTAELLHLYDGELAWIYLHVLLGTIALLTGPIQLWLGFAHRRMSVHRTLGKVYMGTILLGAIIALRLAFTPSVGIAFGFGLGVLAIVWVLTTGMAYVAIRRRQIAQHREWMIRSYVTTFAFVFFRMIVVALTVAGIGTQPEQLTIAAWLCWSLPLVVTEVVLQSRRTLGQAQVARV